MSIKCYELVDSMSGSVVNESEGGEVREVKRRYVIGRCESGFNQAVLEMEKYAPAYVNGDGAGLYWVRRRLEVNGIGNAYFDCTAIYQTLQPKAGDDPETQGDFVPGGIAWDTTGHTEHITQGLEDEIRFPANAPAFDGALNVSGESVNGVDVPRPHLRYSETWIMPTQVAMSCQFVGAVYRLTGTANLNAFRCFAPGEVAFFGGRAQWNGDQPYVAVTFDWEARPNGDVNMPYFKGRGELNGLKITKEGWQHLWIRYEPESDSGSLIRYPTAAYINTVLEKKSWADLGMIAGVIGAPQAGANGQAPAGGGIGFF